MLNKVKLYYKDGRTDTFKWGNLPNRLTTSELVDTPTDAPLAVDGLTEAPMRKVLFELQGIERRRFLWWTWNIGYYEEAG